MKQASVYLIHVCLPRLAGQRLKKKEGIHVRLQQMFRQADERFNPFHSPGLRPLFLWLLEHDAWQRHVNQP